jgi:photosystem II stability/assembly factor-like uncharacterized protein
MKFAFRSRIVLVAVLAFVIPVSTVLAQAASRPWTPFGPGGGSVYSLTVDPRDPAVVYAIAGTRFESPGTLYKSTDGGTTWKTLAAGSGLQAVALDPEHPGTVYAGGFSLLRSTNGGRTWSDASPHTERAVIRALAVAPGGVVFAGDGPRLLRSADGGRNWAIVSRDIVDVTAILVNPADPLRLYHLSRNALYTSEDGGLHWASAPPPAPPANPGLVLAPSAPGRLYFLSSIDTRVYRSDDGARTWRVVGEVPSSGKVTLVVDSRSADRVYAANSAGIFTSADGGSTWRQITAGLPRPLNQPLPITALVAAPSRPDTLYAGTEEWGVARSADAGAHWRIGVETGLNGAVVALLKFHPLRPGTVYLGLGLDGTRSFRSTDGGRTWQGFARSITQQGWKDLAFDPDDPGVLYAVNSLGTWKSADGGETWARISADAPGQLAALGRQTLLASPCGLRRSTDEGRTWKQVIACADVAGHPRTPLSLWVNPRDARNVYVHFAVSGGTHYYNFEVFKSRDGGITWTKPRALSFPTLFAVAPGDFRILYALDEPLQGGVRLLRSVDGGESWKVVNRNLPPNGSYFSGFMVVDAADPYTVYISANPLVVSHDGGASFEAITAPFEAGKLGTIRLWTGLTSPGFVYAAAEAGGLFAGSFE